MDQIGHMNVENNYHNYWEVIQVNTSNRNSLIQFLNLRT